MTNLTEKEGLFLKALFDDYFERGKMSFLSILFHSKYAQKDDLKEYALSMFEMKENIDFINKSKLLFETYDEHVIGKKGDFFFSTCRLKEFISLGRNIQDLPYYLNFNDLSYILEIEGSIKNTNYHKYIEDYMLFCEENNMIYCAHLKKDFLNDILILDKEEVIFEEKFTDKV